LCCHRRAEHERDGHSQPAYGTKGAALRANAQISSTRVNRFHRWVFEYAFEIPLFFIVHPQCKFNPGITPTYAARKETKGDAPRRQMRIVCGVHLPAHGNRRVDDRAVDQFILRAHRTDQVLGPIFAACIQDWPPPAVAEIVADYLDHGREIPHALAPREA
jgi:hypothetical protein